MSKKIRGIIIAVAVVVLLAVSLIVALNMEPKNKEETPVEQGNTALFEGLLSSAITEVQIQKKSGEITLTKTAEGTLLLNQDEKFPLSMNAGLSVFSKAVSPAYSKVVQENSDKEADYGLAESSAVVELRAGSKIYRYEVGSASPMGDGYYIRAEGDKRILLGGDLSAITSYGKLDYVETAIIPSVSNAEDKRVTALSITGAERADDPLEIVYKAEGEKTESGTLSPYKMTKPYAADANDDQLAAKIIDQISTLKPAKAAYVYPTETEKEACGLNSPALKLSFTYGDTKYTYFVGNEAEDGTRYFSAEGIDVIYTIDNSALAFLRTPAFDVMSKIVYLRYIDTLEFLKVSTPEKNVTFHTEGDMENLKVTFDGKTVKTEDFQSAYQEMIGVLVSGINNTAPAGAPIAEINFKPRDAEKTDTVAFYPLDARKLTVTLNGQNRGYVMRGDVEKMLNTVFALAQ